jgi:ornithine--oxo-acid transaminase
MSAEHSHIAHNYASLNEGLSPLSHGEDVWVWDTEGNKYLDFLSGYSANNFGHRHPEIIAALKDQADRLTLTARAFDQDQLEPFAAELSELTGKDKILPMNTGAEAVETAIKLSRKWGYEVKGVESNQANIIVMNENFHGRTTTIISYSDDDSARDGFGPYTPGFRRVQYGNVKSIENAMDENTVAVLFEPIQGEAGVIVPPDGFLRDLREVCTRENVLMVADEIQSGLGRTGKTFACDHEDVVPDVYILGKALGGGVMPVSAVAANSEIMDVIKAGEHGSTFGGNPLACAVARAAIRLLKTNAFQENARMQGKYMHECLNGLMGLGVTAVRGRGLWAGIDIDPTLMSGHDAAERLYDKGLLAKDTHGSTIRFSPPLTIERQQVHEGVSKLAKVLREARK